MSSQLRAGYREQIRAALLQSALELVEEEGDEALTIKRLAERFGSSIGTIYRFFPSKHAIVAAMRQQELAGLRTAAASAIAQIDASLAAVDAPRHVTALARVVGAGNFWLHAAESSPRDVLRARQVLGDPGLQPASGQHVLDPLASTLDDAVAADALADGHSRDRAALIAMIVPLSSPTLGGDARSDPDLGRCLLECLLESWGADPDSLTRAHDLVANGTDR